MKKFFCFLLTVCMLCVCACSLAAQEPEFKELEDTIRYDDTTISVKIERWRYNYGKTDCRFFLVDVTVAEPSQLRTALSYDKYTEKATEPTTEMAVRNQAVLAVNGDYYNYNSDMGMIIRNGVLYRDLSSSRDPLLVYADGRFAGYKRAEFDFRHGKKYIEDGVVQAFDFGPLLVRESAPVDLPKTYYVSTKDSAREPRTGIGQIDATHYVLIVADGRREGWSDKGMTLREMQGIFMEKGCVTAYNLDGGGSSSLVLNGERINRGISANERSVSDIVYFCK